MFKLICVTARGLCKEDFLTRVDGLARAGLDALILREKDLDQAVYLSLARRVLPLCQRENLPCALHFYPEAARALGVKQLHLPLALLKERPELRGAYEVLGVSVHSAQQARLAWELGADYLTAGHIFATACKKGLPPRGLAWLEGICREAKGPVYAIGGIDEGNIRQVRGTGAAGACVMSGLMGCDDLAAKVASLKRAAGM